MKTLITQLAAGVLAFATLGLASCKKDEVQATLTATPNPTTLTASATTLNLTQVNASQNAITFNFTPLTFSWANAEHTYNPSVVYTLQVAKQGTNFASPVSIDLGVGPAKTFTVADFNAALLAGNYPYATAQTSDIRVKASYAANSPVYSNTLPLTATTYCAQPAASSAWSIIGPAGIDWNTDLKLTYDCATGNYTYTGPLNAGDFKFRYGAAWTTNLGGNSSTGGALTQGGNNLTITTAKTYTVVLTATVDGSGNGSGSFTIK